MRTGILVNEIMEKEFPIVNSEMFATLCVKKFNGSLGILVMKNGNFLGIVGYGEILKGLIKEKNNKIKRKVTVEKILPRQKNFSVVKSGKDAFFALRMIKNGKDFVIVKEKKNILGLITKKDALDAEERFLEELPDRKLNKNFTIEKCENCLVREPKFFLGGKILCEECI